MTGAARGNLKPRKGLDTLRPDPYIGCMRNRKNPIAKAVRTPRFRPRIVKSGKVYDRKGQKMATKYTFTDVECNIKGPDGTVNLNCRPAPKPMAMYDRIIAYEQGDMEQEDIVSFFQDLIDSGLAWTLQGHYGRTAAHLIETGYCIHHT